MFNEIILQMIKVDLFYIMQNFTVMCVFEDISPFSQQIERRDKQHL